MEQVIRIVKGKLITVQKVDNGYIATCVEPPQEERITPEEEERRIDRLIETVPTIIKRMYLHKVENWQRDHPDDLPDQKMLREAFRAMYPELVKSNNSCPQPKLEIKVFQTIDDLFEYLKEIL